MDSPLIQLARTELSLRKFTLLRWMVHACLGILLLSALVYGPTVGGLLWGILLFLLPAGVLLDIFQLFVRQEVEKHETKSRETHEGMTYELAMILARGGNRPRYIWYYLVLAPSTRFVLMRLGVPPREFEQTLGQSLPTYDVWMKNSLALAHAARQPLGTQHLFEALQQLPGAQSFWRQLGVQDQERSDVWQWYQRVVEDSQSIEKGLLHQLRFSGGIGRDWSSGYTHSLEAFAADITNQLQRVGQTITLIGHTEERKKILEYLNRSHAHNVILVGEEGIGKQRLIYSLASDFVLSRVPLNLKYKHLYMLDVGRIISGSSPQEQEQRLQAVLAEAATVGNVILVIPDFHLLVGAQKQTEMGTMNASAVIAPYLASSSIHIIALTTPDDYYRSVKPNQSLEGHLLPIEVKEIGSLEALHILQDEVFRYEVQGRQIFTYQALVKMITVAEQHVHNKPYPEKVLSLLDEVAGATSGTKGKLVTDGEVEKILSEKLKVPLTTQTSASERDVLNNLETLIRDRIIGQSEAVKVVANALRRVRAGLHSGKRPIGSFLFLGPTGVGKTEMAKTIAALYYKNPKAFIRLDMSEYQTADSITKIIGTDSAPGLLTTAITDQPFSVVLLDEIEKAAPSIRNLFLQILDDGHITDGYGKRVDFTNAMVIATSNAGSEFIRESVQQNVPAATLKPQLLERLQSQGIFSPEWLNRFDSIVVFLPLAQDEIRQVAKLQVTELVDRVKEHNINLSVADDVYELLVERGFDPQFGARPMRRAVQDILESALAKALLNDTQAGTKDITVTRAMLS